MKNALLMLFSFLSLSLPLSFQAYTQRTCNNFDDFKDACANAQPGDEIILVSGRYEAESITIKDAAGTPENPVIEYNHFKNMGPRAANEMEAIRIPWSPGCGSVTETGRAHERGIFNNKSIEIISN